MLHIYYDAYQEAAWFASLHPSLHALQRDPFPRATDRTPGLSLVLNYDRPDIVLMNDDVAILVLERTVEVPSGHNVGQRFARLVSAAQAGVPAVYFGPYVAYKHGGETAGPRWMNLRLFKAIDKVMEVEGSPITTVCWPVDSDFEIIQGAARDVRMRLYMDLFFAAFELSPATVGQTIIGRGLLTFYLSVRVASSQAACAAM